MTYTITPSQDADKTHLAEIRAEAMQPSLEAIGRFNPERVRSRFLDGFTAQNTHNILIDNQLVGFYTLSTKNDELWLEHLYFLNKCQGQGLGKSVLDHIKNIALNQNKPLKLQALRDSPANGFYQHHGFVETHQEEWDVFYQWNRQLKD